MRLCAQARKHVQVQKPIAVSPAIAREMIDTAASAGILLHVVSQHRFDDSSLFLASALEGRAPGTAVAVRRLREMVRNDAYYARPGKGTWSVEGGGALINQGIHQVDLLQWLAGPVHEVSAMWQLGALHAIESEDVVSAMLRYAGGATGVIQAATAFRPGYPERMEFHGTRDGDRDRRPADGVGRAGRRRAAGAGVDGGGIGGVRSDGDLGRVVRAAVPGFRRGDAQRRQPLVSGEAGLQAVAVVDAIYRSCRSGERIVL